MLDPQNGFPVLGHLPMAAYGYLRHPQRDMPGCARHNEKADVTHEALVGQLHSGAGGSTSSPIDTARVTPRTACFKWVAVPRRRRTSSGATGPGRGMRTAYVRRPVKEDPRTTSAD
ncbi:hypothetical protein GCM10017687_01700 [Streptomyces echinatus]